VEKSRGSAKAIREIISLGGRISIEEMADLAEMTESAGGAVIAVYPQDDDWCGTGVIRIKWPVPKPEPFLSLLDKLAESRINFEVLINGIPVPDHIIMKISRQIGRY